MRYRNRLAQIIAGRIGGHAVAKGAAECGVPYHVLRDALYLGTCPRPIYLVKIATWTGFTVEELALAAQEQPLGVNGGEEASTAPPQAVTPHPAATH